MTDVAQGSTRHSSSKAIKRTGSSDQRNYWSLESDLLHSLVSNAAYSELKIAIVPGSLPVASVSCPFSSWKTKSFAAPHFGQSSAHGCAIESISPSPIASQSSNYLRRIAREAASRRLERAKPDANPSSSIPSVPHPVLRTKTKSTLFSVPRSSNRSKTLSTHSQDIHQPGSTAKTC